MKKYAKTIIFWVVILFLVIMLVVNPPWRQPPKQVPFTDFLSQVKRNSVDSVKIFNKDQTIQYQLKNKEQFKTAFPPNYDTVSYTHLRAHETRHDLVCRLLLEK